MALLNWRHHALIQALMASGPLQDDDFRQMFFSIASINPNRFEKEFNEYLLMINKELSYVQMELRVCRNQNGGRVYYGLVNNVADQESKLGTKYSVPQILFFKAIMEAIINDVKAHGSISNFDALNLRLESQDYLSQVPAALRNFSMSHKQKTIDELVKDKWLGELSDGGIELGVRSYLELRSLFRNHGIPLCDLCNEAGIKAKVCPNEECTVRMHDYCLKNKLSKSRSGISCPNCGAQWQNVIPKTEATEDHNEVEVTESEPPAASTRREVPSKRNRNAKTEAAGEENAADYSESQAAAGSRGKRLRSNRNGTQGISESVSSQVSHFHSDSRRVTRSSGRR